MLIHTVQQGDTLWQIAKTHQISLDSLLMANPQISDPNMIMPGMKINIPQISPYCREDKIIEDPKVIPVTEKVVEQEVVVEEIKTNTLQEKPYIYSAKEGDSLVEIAKINDVSLQELLSVNQHLSNCATLKAGEKVYIPGITPAIPHLPCEEKEKVVVEEKTVEIEEITCPYCGFKIRRK